MMQPRFRDVGRVVIPILVALALIAALFPLQPTQSRRRMTRPKPMLRCLFSMPHRVPRSRCPR